MTSPLTSLERDSCPPCFLLLARHPGRSQRGEHDSLREDQGPAYLISRTRRSMSPVISRIQDGREGLVFTLLRPAAPI